ncbi:MAG: tyrosine-type recombinase/integrase [Planctomycetota bacterium]|jgi:integrase
MDQSVASAYELYLARSDLRPASVRIKQRALGYFVEWFGDLPVGRVNAAVAEDYRTMLAKGRSKVSANGYLANFKPFWVWLWRHNRIETNPFDAVRLYRITEARRETFTSSELTRLLKSANRLWRVRICLGLMGCRRGETLNLTVRDVHLDGDEPHIVLSPKPRTSHTWPWEIKDHAVRYVGLPEIMRFDGAVVELHRDIVALLEELPAKQPYVCLESRYYLRLIALQEANALPDERIADPTGNFQRMFRRLQRQAMVEPTKRYHELRAAFATAMIEQHGLSRAADALGHSSTQITRKYDRKSPMSLVADVNRIAKNCYQSLAR